MPSRGVAHTCSTPWSARRRVRAAVGLNCAAASTSQRKPRTRDSLQGGTMKTAALWIFGLGARAPNARAADGGVQFEYVQYDAWYNSLRDAAVAYEHKDYQQAFALSRQAACAGDKTTKAVLGRMYLRGQTPTRDDLTGYAWIKLSAEFGFADFTSLARKLEAALTPEIREKGNARADALRRLYGLGA